MSNNLFFDIETGKAIDYEIFEPIYREPRITKTGAIHASDKSVEDQRKECLDKCCISPFTGRVILTGTILNKDYVPYWENSDCTEKDLLNNFWQMYREAGLVIGFDIKRFDLPFLMKRSFKHKLTIPDVMDRRAKYFLDNIIDIRDQLMCGEWQGKGSLDDYSKFFGLQDKDTEVSEQFEYIWNTNKERAIKGNQIEVENIRDIYNLIVGTKPKEDNSFMEGLEK